jgi:hypothetical protein
LPPDSGLTVELDYGHDAEFLDERATDRLDLGVVAFAYFVESFER